MASFVKGSIEKKGLDTGIGLAKSGGQAAAKEALKVAKDESKKVIVKLTNKTKQKWTRPKIFLDKGATDAVLPLTVENDQDIEYEVHKKKWTFSGVAAAITYEWKDSGKTYYLAVMIRKPMISRNNWNAVIFETDTEANQELFRQLRQQNGDFPPMACDSNYISREFGPYTLQGAMASTGTSVDITISCTADLDQ